MRVSAAAADDAEPASNLRSVLPRHRGIAGKGNSTQARAHRHETANPRHRWEMWLAAVLAAIATASTLLLSTKVSVAVDVIGWATMLLLLQRAVQQRRRLQQAHDVHAHLGGRLTAERDELSSQLGFWANHDALTRLANRARFTRIVADALGAGQPCGVMTISLAEFGVVNSTHGDRIGDQVLQTIAERLHRSLRGHDVAGRLGGDDFGVLLRDLDVDTAQAAGDRVLGILNDPFVIGQASVSLQARAGITVSSQEQIGDAAELLRRSEVAAAASPARNRVHVFAPAMQALASERSQLETDLRRALEAGDIVSHYQPLVNAHNGCVQSVEALVRWTHPTRGIIAPQQFIPVAEQSGLIVDLGLTVLRQACRQLTVWQQTTDSSLTVAVNLSARQLSEVGFVQSVADVVWGSGVDPHHIVLEITESLLLADSEAALDTLSQLRSLGFRLAVDDFGTGYSSLSRLSDMPIDEMKIDKSFVDRIGAAVNDSTPIIAAAIAMGHALGLTVVAEGVETPAQATFLVDSQCDLLQGYLMSRPVEASAITPLLNRRVLDKTPAAVAAGNHPVSESVGGAPPALRVLPSAERHIGTRRLFAR